MTKDKIRAAILEVLADVTSDDNLDGLSGDVALRDQIELDSMDFLDLIMELQKRYDIEVPEEDYEQLSTLDSIVDYLEPLMVGMKQ